MWLAFLNQAPWKDADFLGLIWTGEGLGAGWDRDTDLCSNRAVDEGQSP